MKILKVKSLIALGLLLCIGQSSATDEANCGNIVNVLERLACYDESHKAQTDRISAADLRDNSSPIGIVNDVFGDRDKTVVTASLVEVDKLPRSGALLYLNNSQVWQLAKKRALSAEPGDDVVIQRGLIGGHLVRVNGGALIPVKRIE
jgi:hypothetical protein